jgi:two-component system, NarL family, sensor kinase
MFVASVPLYVLARSAQSPGNWVTVGTVGGMLGFVPFLAFPLVGALVASRRPHNPVGWICIVAGLFWELIILSEYYSTYGLGRPGSVPFPVTIHALLYAWMWVPAVGLIGTYLILLFPNGRLPSKRWRPLAWLSGAVIVLLSVATFLTPGPLDDLGGCKTRSG